MIHGFGQSIKINASKCPVTSFNQIYPHIVMLPCTAS